jgi:glycerophosphoryl diester phosphodiesterase
MIHRYSASAKAKPLVIAHRGASGLAPENTLAAFRLAVGLGADGVELDVQLSADGQPVVLHDAHLTRTTSGAGAVSSLTLAQLERLDAGSWFARRMLFNPRLRKMAERAALAAGSNGLDYWGEPVPSLENALAFLGQAGLYRIYIELKTKLAYRDRMLKAAISLIRQNGLQDRVTLLSFDHEIVRLAKQLAPEIRTAATFPVAGHAFTSARLIAAAARSTAADEAALHFGLATRRTVAALGDAGLTVSAWTANSKLVMKRLIACGVDAVMTNFPNRLIEVINSASLRRRS